jgi:hypothetical protein
VNFSPKTSGILICDRQTAVPLFHFAKNCLHKAHCFSLGIGLLRALDLREIKEFREIREIREFREFRVVWSL